MMFREKSFEFIIKITLIISIEIEPGFIIYRGLIVKLNIEKILKCMKSFYFILFHVFFFFQMCSDKLCKSRANL